MRCVRFLGSAIVGVLVVGLVSLAGLSASMGPLGPAYAPFAENDATFPEDTVNASASCDEFRVGVAKRDIVPGVPLGDGAYALWYEPFEDANGNGVYDAPNPLAPDDHFDPFTDENGNLKWDGPYMAGYGHRKANNQYYTAASVHDPVWARALAFECGSLLVGMVSLDVVGFFQHEVWDIRDRVLGAGFDHVIVASTHTHDSVDTMGLWGPNEVGESYILDILYVALSQPKPHRFVDLQRELKMSPNTLSARLRALVNAGLLTRTAFSEIPPRVEYRATKKAVEFGDMFEALDDWAKRNSLEPVIVPTP